MNAVATIARRAMGSDRAIRANIGLCNLSLSQKSPRMADSSPNPDRSKNIICQFPDPYYRLSLLAKHVDNRGTHAGNQFVDGCLVGCQRRRDTDDFAADAGKNALID